MPRPNCVTCGRTAEIKLSVTHLTLTHLSLHQISLFVDYFLLLCMLLLVLVHLDYVYSICIGVPSYSGGR
jgi:hypothetical protein